jgi:predicted SnoaL-like aldol condensation-catalyzing enzyme
MPDSIKCTRICLLAALLTFLVASVSGQDNQAAACSPEIEEQNKALARRLYEQVWFSNNPEVVDEIFAPEYVVHDTGDLKGVTEPASMQKDIAGFLWENGSMSGSIDYQIADCNMVATRWQWKFKPTSLMFKILGGRDQIPIINVFRFENGKVVEVWNHRHDIDWAWGNVKFYTGLAVGLIPSLILAVVLLLLWRRLRKTRAGTV